jgi:hypothetical protein
MTASPLAFHSDECLKVGRLLSVNSGSIEDADATQIIQ